MFPWWSSSRSGQLSVAPMPTSEMPPPRLLRARRVARAINPAPPARECHRLRVPCEHGAPEDGLRVAYARVRGIIHRDITASTPSRLFFCENNTASNPPRPLFCRDFAASISLRAPVPPSFSTASPGELPLQPFRGGPSCRRRQRPRRSASPLEWSSYTRCRRRQQRSHRTRDVPPVLEVARGGCAVLVATMPRVLFPRELFRRILPAGISLRLIRSA
ncbi:hypothetical protein FB451DRAFT_1559782 [Mycena latifolia]|nr:hypothetical protein FB451DRAFT_1559782 [Mycena latifolia]